MSSNDRYIDRLKQDSALVGEWKGDANAGRAIRVNPDGTFTVTMPRNPDEPGIYNEEVRNASEWHGEIWFSLNNYDTDFVGKDGDPNYHRVGPYYFGKPDRVDFTNSDGGHTFVERLSDYNIRYATNGH